MQLIVPQRTNCHWNFELFQHNLGLVSSAGFTISLESLMQKFDS